MFLVFQDLLPSIFNLEMLYLDIKLIVRQLIDGILLNVIIEIRDTNVPRDV